MRSAADRSEPTLAERMKDVRAIGRLAWIGVRPARETPMRVIERATVITGRGLEGDRATRGAIPSGKRHVTLIQAEHLPVIAALLGRAEVSPELLRRNLVVSGINLVALKTLRFRIGEHALLEGTGPCEPCAKMDAALGEGGFQAMRGHGGLTARVIEGGEIAIGDTIRVA
ncbi:MAG: MOSC domain-containing protein [Sandaracinus sp.]